jgi:hypothetical protein
VTVVPGHPFRPDPLSDPDDYCPALSPPASIEVEVTEPEVVGVLLGPDGEPLIVLWDREPIDFGFQIPD